MHRNGKTTANSMIRETTSDVPTTALVEIVLILSYCSKIKFILYCMSDTWFWHTHKV